MRVGFAAAVAAAVAVSGAAVAARLRQRDAPGPVPADRPFTSDGEYVPAFDDDLPTGGATYTNGS